LIEMAQRVVQPAAVGVHPRKRQARLDPRSRGHRLSRYDARFEGGDLTIPSIERPGHRVQRLADVGSFVAVDPFRCVREFGDTLEERLLLRRGHRRHRQNSRRHTCHGDRAPQNRLGHRQTGIEVDLTYHGKYLRVFNQKREEPAVRCLIDFSTIFRRFLTKS
jgi:hypothetical protein